jgi:hypothetical protein
LLFPIEANPVLAINYHALHTYITPVQCLPDKT